VLGDMTFSCKAHWAYSLQAYFGSDYLLLAHQNTGADGTALILMAKKAHAAKITNIRVIFAPTLIGLVAFSDPFLPFFISLVQTDHLR